MLHDGEFCRTACGLASSATRRGPRRAPGCEWRACGRSRGRGAPVLGPRYLLLDDAFAAVRRRAIPHRVERILITLGGADPAALTPHLMAWAREACGMVALDDVVGPFFSDDCRRRVQDLADDNGGMVFHPHPPELRALMLRGNLAVTAGGQTAYELAAAGTPQPAGGVTTIEGVQVIPLRRIPDERGTILRMLKSTDPHFRQFGEIYVDSLESLRSLAAGAALVTRAAAVGCRRFVAAGTCFEYDTSNERLSERSPTRPNNLYGASKLAFELVAGQLARAAGMSVAWPRLFYLTLVQIGVESG